MPGIFSSTGFCLLRRRTRYLAVAGTFVLALCFIAVSTILFPDYVINLLKDREIQLVKNEIDQRWKKLENDLETPRVDQSMEQGVSVKREIVRYFEDVLYQSSDKVNEFQILRARREILGKDDNFTQAGEALYGHFDDSERITNHAVQNFISQRPVSRPHVEFNDDQGFPENFDLIGRLFLMALAEGADAPDALVSAIRGVPSRLSEDNLGSIAGYLDRNGLSHERPKTWLVPSYDVIFNGDCVDDYHQSEKCFAATYVSYYYERRPANGDSYRARSAKPQNTGGGSYSRLDGHPYLGGVLVGRLPEDKTPLEIAAIEWSDEDGNIRLGLQLPGNEQPVGIGLFKKDIINLALKFVADGRPALVTILPLVSLTGLTEVKVFLHPALQNTHLGCKATLLDRLVDTLYEKRDGLEQIDGMNLVSQVRVEPYTLDDSFRFIYGPENSHANATWPFYFTVYYVKQVNTPVGEYDNFLADAGAAREYSLDIRKDITGAIHQSLSVNHIDENLFADLREFVVAQRVFRLALLGYFGNGFPVEQLIELAQYTEGSVEHVKTSTGQQDPAGECPDYFS